MGVDLLLIFLLQAKDELDWYRALSYVHIFTVNAQFHLRSVLDMVSMLQMSCLATYLIYVCFGRLAVYDFYVHARLVYSQASQRS